MSPRHRHDPLDAIDERLRSRLRPAGRAAWREPMLATLTENRFSHPAWLFERKLDGVRVLAVRNGGAPRLWSRNRNRLDAGYPELVDALDRHGPDSFVADGEIVAFEGRQTSFARLQQRIHLTDGRRIAATGVEVFLYLFDLPALAGVDLSDLPLRLRKQILRETFTFQERLRFCAHRNAQGERYFAEACGKGWEGLIAKRADSAYRSGRTRDWLKLKCVRGQEMVIGGYTDPGGSRVAFGALLVGYYDDGRLRYAGKVGTGFDQATLRRLLARMQPLEQPSSPFADPVAEPRPHWVRPELVAQIGFSEWTGDGRLRHPRFTGLREDKPARDVVRESR